MKTKTLLIVCALALNTLAFGTTYTVTNTDAAGAGSFSEAYTAATTGDIINFNFDGTDFNIDAAIVMKSITIDGLNAFNSQRIVIKQTVAAKNFFTLAAGITGTFKNIVFDGSAGANKLCITSVNGSILNIDNCVFKNINSGADNGGAARIQGVANITNTLFENNSCAGTYGGGALCIYNAADVIIDKCSFIGNTANLNGVSNGGGAISARATTATDCNVKITNSTFANNTAGKTGGALLSSVVSSSVYTTNLTAVNCTFTGNKGDGAVSCLTTVKGNANTFLVNCIVVNNINAAGDAYSDLFEKTGTDVATVARVEVHNVIYSVASELIVTTGTNSIQIADPTTATIFWKKEAWGTGFERPVITTMGEQKVALLSLGSVAINSGTASLASYTIPTVDQLDSTRASTPAIGAVEYNPIVVTGVNQSINNSIKLIVKGKQLNVTGLDSASEMSIYSMTGNLLDKRMVNNNTVISLSHLQSNIVIVKVQNKSFKVVLN